MTVTYHISVFFSQLKKMEMVDIDFRHYVVKYGPCYWNSRIFLPGSVRCGSVLYLFI